MPFRLRGFGGLRVLVAGGGVAGLEALLALRALAGDLVDLELIAPETAFWYRPLAVAEPFDAGRTRHCELAGFAEAAAAVFTLGEIASVDTHANVAHTSHAVEIGYDVLVLACGSLAAVQCRLPGGREHPGLALAHQSGPPRAGLAPACCRQPLPRDPRSGLLPPVRERLQPGRPRQRCLHSLGRAFPRRPRAGTGMGIRPSLDSYRPARAGDRRGTMWPVGGLPPCPARSRGGDSGLFGSGEAVPHHCFHVFAVYPWLGLLRTGVVEQPLHILDQCRTTPAVVCSVDGDWLEVLARPLLWDAEAAALRLGDPAARNVRWRADGLAFVHRPGAGEHVSLHWDFVCDVLTPQGAAALVRATDRSLQAVNRPAVAGAIFA